MRTVAVFGLGYVGCVTGACLSQDGHRVIGVDVDADKVAEVNSGVAPISEPGLEEVLRTCVDEGRFTATTDAAEAVACSELAFVAVGTPSADDGSVTTQALERVVQAIGVALRKNPKPYHIVIRSTLLPGILEGELRNLLASAAGSEAMGRISLSNNPEFLREGTAVKDYYNPPYVLVGAASDEVANDVLSLYEKVHAERFVTDSRTAALVKYASNCFHALKISFANEIGSLAKAIGANGHEVMRLVRQDRKLNVSEAYLRPGFAFGGSCLPKDLRALTRFADEQALKVNVLQAVLSSNESHLKRALKLIRDSGHRQIGLVGLSFKAGTDDLRESPSVELVETLLGWGNSIKIYDPNVMLGRLRGRNLAYIDRHLPHLADLLVPHPIKLIEHATLIVLCSDVADSYDWSLAAGKQVVDLRRCLASA